MAKKRKLKTSVYILAAMILFLLSYIICFNRTIKYYESKNIVPIDQEVKEDTRSLRAQLNDNTKKYISNSSMENVNIDDSYWKEVVTYMNQFSKIRETSDFKPVYSGYNENGVKFDTDLDIFRVHTITKEEFYKIPVSIKEEFSNILKTSLYTSFDFIKKYKTWDKVEIIYKDEVKKISKWKFDDLAKKMSSKRIVGEVQPIKGKERSEHNFTIEIAGEGYNINIDTMSENYLRVYSQYGETYYEVPTTLHKYLKNEIFKIVDEEKEG